MMPLEQLDEQPKQFPDCCVGLSKPLVTTLVDRLPSGQALILSIGCGSGLLEQCMLQASGQTLNVYGVEVPDCRMVHLRPDRVLRVPDTRALHPDAMLASVLMFVYPRMPELIASYVEAFKDGALEQVVWLGHRSDWPDGNEVLQKGFDSVEIIESPGLAPYEILAIASMARFDRSAKTLISSGDPTLPGPFNG